MPCSRSQASDSMGLLKETRGPRGCDTNEQSETSKGGKKQKEGQGRCQHSHSHVHQVAKVGAIFRAKHHESRHTPAAAIRSSISIPGDLPELRGHALIVVGWLDRMLLQIRTTNASQHSLDRQSDATFKPCIFDRHPTEKCGMMLV